MCIFLGLIKGKVRIARLFRMSQKCIQILMVNEVRVHLFISNNLVTYG